MHLKKTSVAAMMAVTVVIAAAFVLFMVDRNQLSDDVRKNTENGFVQDLKRLGQVADFQGIIDYANSVLQDPEYGNDMPVRLLCLVSAAQSYIKTDWIEKAVEYLDSASVLLDAIPVEMRQDSIYVESFYTYCNAMILRYVYGDVDYHEAIKYATTALDSADKRKDIRQNIIFGTNYSILNTQIQESYAYEGAEELYEKAVALNDRRQIFQTAQLCAWRYTLLKDVDKARQYIKVALDNLPEGYMDASTLYADYARILHLSGFQDSAEYYFDMAIRAVDKEVSSSTLSVYLSYAEFLDDVGDTASARNILMQGLSLADSANSRWNRKSFYYGLYHLYMEREDYLNALLYMDSYVKETDSVAEERQRKDLIEMRVKYETAVKEKIIAQQNEKISMIAAVVAICVVICILLLILYLHKQKSYRTLFRMYSEVLSDRARLRETHTKNIIPKNSGKNDLIFGAIEKLMVEQHIYRDNSLTVEKAASRINSNRTYLAAAIKQNTGLSFIYYVNSYRIKEAISILSDPDNDTPLKAIVMDVGFKSPTTFYKLSSEATGKTPQIWRNEVKSTAKSIQNLQL